MDGFINVRDRDVFIRLGIRIIKIVEDLLGVWNNLIMFDIRVCVFVFLFFMYM